MMQKIIDETREYLAPLIGIETVSSAAHILNLGPQPRLIRKIPNENYVDLDRLVPISWL